jgi:hypothetical protein
VPTVRDGTIPGRVMTMALRRNGGLLTGRSVAQPRGNRLISRERESEKCGYSINHLQYQGYPYDL